MGNFMNLYPIYSMWGSVCIMGAVEHIAYLCTYNNKKIENFMNLYLILFKCGMLYALLGAVECGGACLYRGEYMDLGICSLLVWSDLGKSE